MKKKYNLNYLAMYLFLSTSIGLTSLNTYKLYKSMKPVTIEVNNEPYMDLHISDFLDEIDKEFAPIEEDNRVVLFADSEDYYDLDTNEYVTEEEIIKTEEFQVTTDNKTYEYLPDEDFNLFTAVVAAECNGNKYDALAVASSILNRCDSEEWIADLERQGMDGENPIHHIKAPGQYTVYHSGGYLTYMDDVDISVVAACELAWFEGIRNHNYCSFRSNNATYYSDNQIVEDGNRFSDELVLKKDM